jgi:uncharacterized membrane protein
MITTQHVFFLIGAMFAAYALLSLTDRSNKKRFGNAAFWGLLALSLIGGTWIGDFANGLVVLALAGIASLKLIGRGEPEVNEEQQTANGERYGDKLFLPILIVLLTAVLGTLLFLYVPGSRSSAGSRRSARLWCCSAPACCWRSSSCTCGCGRPR